MIARLFILASFVLYIQILNAQTIFDLNQNLGRGINMGNMFEAPNENAWNNPFQDDYFTKIAELGFDHVRIPIRWDTSDRALQNTPYTIDRNFIERIQYVIDKAIAADLYVMINMHHFEELFSHPDETKPRFLRQWEQIGEVFKDYDDHLLFEVLNEPNTNLTPEKWNQFFAEALSTIRMTNPTRAVLMGVANWGGLGSVSDLVIPEDDKLILTIHYYEPFQFTHQGANWVGSNSNDWLGTKWENTTVEREEIEMQFQFVKEFAKEQNLPIHIGEFGAYSTADLDSRVKWTNFLARWFEEQGFSWAYWEFSAGFGIYDPSTGRYLEPLVDALLTTPMSPAVELTSVIIFESDFTESDTEWNLGVQTQAEATYNTKDGVAEIAVSQNSDNSWHVQLIKNGISITEGSRYVVTFEAAADENAALTTYIGKNFGDYAAYSGYKNYTATTEFMEFSYTFIMQSPDDLMARVAFDLASTVTTFYIKNFKIEEILPETSTSLSDVEDTNVLIYPNPAHDFVQLSGIEKYERYMLVDGLGRILETKKLTANAIETVSLKLIHTNVIYLILEDDSEKLYRKILKH